MGASNYPDKGEGGGGAGPGFVGALYSNDPESVSLDSTAPGGKAASYYPESGFFGLMASAPAVSLRY